MLYTANAKLDQKDSIKKFFPLVEKIANQIYKKTQYQNELEDLIQAGVLGLIDGLSKYQIQDNASIETYLSMRIKGAIIDEIRKNDFLSQEDRDLVKKVENETYNNDGTKKEYRQIAENLNITIDKLIYAKGLQVTHLSLNQEENEYLSEVIPSQENLESLLLDKERKTALVKEIEILPEKEQVLMALYYQEDCTFKEISKIMDLSEARVSQIHTLIIKKIKENLKKINII